MLSYSDLKKGTHILLKGQPYEILESTPLFKGRGHSVLQAKIKNLITGTIISTTFHPSDTFEEPEISKIKLKYLYFHKDSYFFCEKDDPSKRFEFKKEQIGKSGEFLKENQNVEGIIFEKKLVNVSLPIKVVLRVLEAPPVIKGQSAQAGTKPVILETGANINVPLFIEKGDIIEVNTETDEYVRRIT